MATFTIGVTPEEDPAKPKASVLVTDSGLPMGNNENSLAVDRQRGTMLSDCSLIEKLTHVNRERVPERIVHAKGFGVIGVFEVTKNISHICAAPLFEKVGEKCKVFVRFSTVAGKAGSADAQRDLRGMAIKMYTKNGNVDILCLSSKMFFIYDGMKFADLTHSQKPRPDTNLHDDNMFWDFIIHNEEAMHAAMFVFSDMGIPKGYQYMDGHAINTFEVIGREKNITYAKFFFETLQGTKYLTAAEAKKIAGEDSDHANRSLINDINSGNFPQWKMFMQTMTTEEAKKNSDILMNPTVIWDPARFPKTEVGILTLNEIPTNFFTTTEQSAFCVCNLQRNTMQGMGKLFEIRSFAYGDTQRYRIGPNFQQLTVNSPLTPVNNYQRDAAMCFNNPGNATNYYPNSFGGPKPDSKYNEVPTTLCGPVERLEIGSKITLEQTREFYISKQEDEKKRMVQNLASSLIQTNPEIQGKVLELLRKVDDTLSKDVKAEIVKMSAPAQDPAPAS